VKVNPASNSSSHGFGNAKKRAIDEHKLQKIVHLIFFERCTLRGAADALGVSHMTVYRALQDADIQFEGDYGRLYKKVV